MQCESAVCSKIDCNRIQMPLHSDHPRYITTINDGLLVAIPAQGRFVTKTFRTVGFTSAATLMSAAVAWRDATWKELFGEEVPARSFHSNARAGSHTGVPGVRLLVKKVRKNSRVYDVPCVLAEIHLIPGLNYARARSSRTRLFSLNKYDFDEAVALATAWRNDMVSKLAAAAK